MATRPGDTSVTILMCLTPIPAIPSIKSVRISSSRSAPTFALVGCASGANSNSISRRSECAASRRVRASRKDCSSSTASIRSVDSRTWADLARTRICAINSFTALGVSALRNCRPRTMPKKSASRRCARPTRERSKICFIRSSERSCCSDLATWTPLSTTVSSGTALALNASTNRRNSERIRSIWSISKVARTRFAALSSSSRDK